LGIEYILAGTLVVLAYTLWELGRTNRKLDILWTALIAAAYDEGDEDGDY
jgi:hypothetical protein